MGLFLLYDKSRNTLPHTNDQRYFSLSEIIIYKTFDMTRDEMIEVLNAIKSPVKEVAIINRMMDELGIPYKPTKCPKCIRDRYNILREELGLIESAAELSEWNEGCKYDYVHHRTVLWKGNKMNQHTNPMIIREFIESGLNANNKYYKQID